MIAFDAANEDAIAIMQQYNKACQERSRHDYYGDPPGDWYRFNEDYSKITQVNLPPKDPPKKLTPEKREAISRIFRSGLSRIGQQVPAIRADDV